MKVFKGVNDRFFLFLRCLRRPTVLTLRQIIILPFDNPTFSLGLRNIQVCHMETILYAEIWLVGLVILHCQVL